MESFYNKLLDNNKKWVESKLSLDPDFFNKLSSFHNSFLAELVLCQVHPVFE